MHWQPRAKIDDPALRALEAAWEGWLRPGGLPSRAMFDPMDFPQLLPWMVLAEIVDHTNTIRSYDVMFRYLGREFERYFNAANMARVHLSHVGPPYIERWFAVYDEALADPRPHYFAGAPFGTGYEYVPLEMLALPFAKVDSGDLGFVLCTFARLESH